ncbi:conjugal transfer protein TraG [Escherichia coli]|uniref:virB8 family protein n=1 Tax=Escherichia coli TaxID=562 RepID=UPI000CF52BBE|nr:type IV secretion system protein [Escherichia coli]PQK43143.1 conjugal transfer protein TraG [Escherichia coli]
MENTNYYEHSKKEASKKKFEEKNEKKDYFKAIRDFERSEIEIIKKKAKTFTILAIGEFVVICILGFAIASLAPLKTAVPFLVRVDNSTGYTDIAPQLSDAKESYQDVETKYFLSKYLIRADSSPLNILKNNYKIKVQINSVILLRKDMAQVRFKKMVLDLSGKPAPGYRATEWISTISFDWDKDIKTEKERLVNPLGLQVLSYQPDPEVIK